MGRCNLSVTLAESDRKAWGVTQMGQPEYLRRLWVVPVMAWPLFRALTTPVSRRLIRTGGLLRPTRIARFAILPVRWPKFPPTILSLPEHRKHRPTTPI